MRRKMVGIFVCMLFIGTVVLPIVNSDNEDVIEKNIIIEAIIEDCGCNKNDQLNEIYYRFPLMDSKYQTLDPLYALPKSEMIDNLPEYFNWKDNNGQDWVTSARDQGSCGSCWLFAAVGALESIIQIREECASLCLDLSEQYVLSCISRAAGTCKGGWAYSAYRYIKSNSSAGNYCNGIIPESCFPYQVTDDVPCANASSNWKNFVIPISEYAHWVPDGSVEDRNAIKTQIFEMGPVVATMLFTIWNHGPDNLEEWGYIHDDPADFFPYPGPVEGANHQVVIVGWKDDSSITNGGYWIVKNSLSEEWGYDGFFNIEYGSLNIDSVDITWVDYNPEDYSNWAPVAKIMGSTQGQVNQELKFNGSSSFDHEGSIVSYVWDFGDGTSGLGSTVTHTYTQQGIYLVTLIVTDNINNSDDQNTWVYIDKENNPPKKPTLRGRRFGIGGNAYSYTFSTNDPDGDDVKYYLNWGDDYWFGGAAGWMGPFASGEEITLEKTFEETGKYMLRVKAQDKYGEKSDWAILEVSMIKNKAINIQLILNKLLQHFPFFEKILNL